MDTQLARALIGIRQMILRGRLKPGQRVAEASLGEMLRMSRTPIRQALPVLAREGLLVESETRGYVVRSFTQEGDRGCDRSARAGRGLPGSPGC